MPDKPALSDEPIEGGVVVVTPGRVQYRELTREEEKERADAERAAPTRALARLRAGRDRLLATSDWTQMPDAPLTDKQRAAWAAYRQRLRDLPASTKDPADPDWPKAP
jgi:hypothetical protein